MAKKIWQKDLKERQVYFVCSWRILFIMVLPLGMDLGVWEDWFCCSCTQNRVRNYGLSCVSSSLLIHSKNTEWDVLPASFAVLSSIKYLWTHIQWIFSEMGLLGDSESCEVERAVKYHAGLLQESCSELYFVTIWDPLTYCFLSLYQ